MGKRKINELLGEMQKHRLIFGIFPLRNNRY